jgi:hypothetical protein
MSSLTETLYRTNRSILEVCNELDVEYDVEDLEDLARCDNCSIWYWEYELIPDTDGLNTCKFCDKHYGM